MKTYTLKSVARRGSIFGAVFAIVLAAVAPIASTYADALNPLTDRSLTLSSSSPGWDYKDGSGNATYAPPNSGANGKETGNTFSFKVSTDSTVTGTNEPIKAMTFQYCTKPAGDCMGPGDIADHSQTNAANVANQKSDLEIVATTPTQIAAGSFGTYFDNASGAVKAVPAANSTGTNYSVYYLDSTDTTAAPAGTWKTSAGWDMTAVVNQTSGGSAGSVGGGTSTGKANQINLVNTTGQGLKAGTPVKVVFFGTSTNYITNPGSGAFFVKINTYKDVDNSNAAAPVVDPLDVIDGGVTVANVMNQSIQIQTKVLETMDFSVGTVDPDTLESLPDDNGVATGGADETSQLAIASGGKYTTHGICNPILNSMDPSNPTDHPINTLLLGDEAGEHSLAVDKTYSTHSYFRLSSNASAGATVYYSGVTLSNTVNDEIKAIGKNKIAPSPGTEQFGLALDNGTSPNWAVNYATERTTGKVYESGADNTAQGLVDLLNGTGTGVHSSVADDWTAANITTGKAPQLQVFAADNTALAPNANYNQGTGVINGGSTGYGGTPNTAFAFDPTSNTIPVAIATEDQHVVDCATGKLRYIANIAATTPAGIYTTKINYIAAPQY
jgi:hypothetical protein